MNVDIIVEARTKSKRFPNKVIKKINNKFIIEIMIERLKKIKNVRYVILATTQSKSDDILIKIAKKCKIKYYRGETRNVMKRVLKCAKSFKTDVIVEITGDNPLIDSSISTEMISFFLKKCHKYDYLSNDGEIYRTKTISKITLGFSTKIFKTSTLEKVNSLTKNKVDQEHLANFILKNPKLFKIFDYPLPPYLKKTYYRLTMDYLEDFLLIKEVYKKLSKKKKYFTSFDIHKFLHKNKYLLNINKSCTQKIYKY